MNQNNDINVLYGLGRRKSANAQVTLTLGSGEIIINDIEASKYLQYNQNYLQKIKYPLILLGIENDYKLQIRAKGGGLTGQADAITLGLARALTKLNVSNRKILKEKGLLTRDSRIKERKKYGLKKARKASQFSKR
jgi:small subunit ribosomal protein S9